MAKPVSLPRWLVQRLLREAQERAPLEACGLIGGQEGRPTSIYPIPNIAGDPKHRFEMDPKAQIAAFRTMRARGETLFAIYHSHPNAPAEPSPRDLALLAYPEALYLIVSLGTKGVLELRGFRAEGEEFVEVPLELEEA